MDNKVWLITGASRGLGRIWAEAALRRGDKVVAAVRKPSDIADFKERYGEAVLPLALDVADADQVQRSVSQAHRHFGRLDVVVNNAGYSLVATAEEASEAEVRALFDVNYFGPLRVIQAVLPLLRAQGSGHIVGVSSALGIVAMPLIGFYSATKWAVESLHESLAAEVDSFGIKVSLVEPGAYDTDFGTPTSLKFAPGLEAYAGLRQNVAERLRSSRKGDPHATAEAILRLVDAENPPLRFILGDQNLPLFRKTYVNRLEVWDAWADVSNKAQGVPKA